MTGPRKMKTTAVWCLVIAISVLAVTESSKRNSTEVSSNERKSSFWCKPTVPPFFVGDKRPVGLPDINRGTEIQQGTPPYFVSLFDPCTNTPFYSAYKVLPKQAAKLGTHGRRKQRWINPPGVPGVRAAYKKANSEATQTFGNELTKGHMNPSGINSFDINFMKATFTLTNAVPQFEASNSGPWQVFENKTKYYAKSTCGSQTRQGTLYLLTGRSENGLNAVPKPQLTNTFTVGDIRVKLETPAAVWTAGCCVWKEPGWIFGNLWKTEKAESFAVMSNNHYNKTQLHQTQMSVIDLEKHLKAAASTTNVHLFPGNTKCARNNIIL